MPPKGQKAAPPPMPGWMNFAIGGISGMLAISIVQPADLVKTRMQLMGPAGKNASIVAVAKEIVAKEGVLAVYTGLSAALFRQATYTTGRLGMFNALFDAYKARSGVPSFPVKVILGIIAGGVGAFIGTPAEVALIRMTADGRLPADKRRNYKNVFNAIGRGNYKFECWWYDTVIKPLVPAVIRRSLTVVTEAGKFDEQSYQEVLIIKEEGITTLWRGAGATVSRAMVVNGAQLGSYAQAREMLLPMMGDGLHLHTVAALISGFITSVSSLPMDMVKTRVQNAEKGASQFQVLTSIIKNEGVLTLWSGLMPTFMKIGPMTILVFIFVEQFNAMYYRSA